MSSGAYLSSDDSALLRGALRNYSGGVCLEIGAGNGGGVAALSKRFGLSVGTDLQLPADQDEIGDSGEFVLADSASCFRDEVFDLVAFNPPYLPSEGIADRTVDGGDGGVEVTLRFLEDAMRVSKREGKIVLLLSSDNSLGTIELTCRKRGYSMRLLDTGRFFYEVLSVYEVSRKEGQPSE